MDEILIQGFGGSQGVREMGLLMESFALNYCFVDGNKRIAFGITDVFLRLNGKVLHVSSKEAEAVLIYQVIEKKVGIEKIALWLEEHASKGAVKI